MKNLKNIFLLLIGVVFLFSSCVKDLDTIPKDPDEVVAEEVYTSLDGYKQVLAKLYAGLAVSGQEGPAGNGDISGIDEGFGQYLRGYWYHQEFPTDEALIAWNDQTVKDFHWHEWGSSDVFIAAMYYRLYYQIVATNSFVRESEASLVTDRGISSAEDVAYFRAEARFLRALSYWHALDLFGGEIPFITEDDPIGSWFPEPTTNEDLFAYIESELLAIEDLMMAPRTNEYGRADQAAVWMLLAKLYLNAEVYIAEDHYSEAAEYAMKVIDAGYSLEDNYEHLFMADNDNSDEVIFSVNYDGVHTQTYGGVNFIIHAAVGGDMNPADYGVGGGWGGLRTTKEFVYKFFPDATDAKLGVVSPIPPKAKDYPVIEVPGNHQGWDPASAPQLASVNSDDIYEGYVYFAEEGNTFKFTQGGGWDVNWGDDGADGTLEPGGTDIVAGEAGYYYLTVDLANLTYTMLKTEWGIIGDATPGAWTDDTDMTYDPESDTWSVLMTLTDGKIKFRANDGWDYNYGDTGVDGILDAGGDDIVVSAGNYLITMKLGTPDYTYIIEASAEDSRAMFFTEGQSLEINDVGQFTDGWAITKWKNINSDGTTGQSLDYADTDFPMFRLADAYLMYAEAVVRGGNGDLSLALELVNELRKRAYGDDVIGQISASELTEDFIIDERGRELYWEGHRRTDLIRFDMLTGDKYIWEWKGNTKDGIPTNAKYNLYPLPSSDVNANPNLSQNPNYGG